MREFAAIAKALADEGRVRILAALEGRELCVCRLISLLGLAPSTVSKHLSILAQAQLITSRKQGRWIYYKINEKNAPLAARRAVDFALESVRSAPQIESDRAELERIMKTEPEELCKNLRCC